MNDNSAIQVRNLSKMYRVFEKPSDLILELVTRKPRHTKFWAIQDVSFDVRRGQVVGIIGRNGAGKTTLLRIIANTLDKTSGSIEIRGKVSAIMALGTGFNLELGGRENILLGGMCLGMSQAEILGKMNSIIDFSGLEAFIDRPVKTYSSGMLSRLAFSTAVSVEPDILIIDEALSTGDMAFTAKSYARIREIARSGATVLFVTHVLQSIYDLCHSAILLDGGRVRAMGEPRKVGYAYEELLHQEMAIINKKEKPVYLIHESGEPGSTCGTKPDAPDYDKKILDDDRRQDGANHAKEVNDENFGPNSIVENEKDDVLQGSPVMGSISLENASPASVIDVNVIDEKGLKVHFLEQQQHYSIQVRVICRQVIKSISVGFRIQNPGGTTIYGTSTSTQGVELGGQTGEIVSVYFTFTCSLACGTYVLSSGVAENLGDLSEHYLYRMIQYNAAVGTIEVTGPFRFSGFADLQSKVKLIEHHSV